MPSNYRYNPFNDASDFVRITERRIIPQYSPFEVMLQEVPLKADPSDVSIKELDLATIGDNENPAGVPYIEVAATPTQGQFWMDYNTGADGDENWNTGRIQFSASDAGKIVEISYTGTGTLATIDGHSDPYWFHDYGDGSDGHMVIDQDTISLTNIVNAKSLIIKEGFKLTPQEAGSPFVIKSQGLVIIEGTLDAKGFGMPGGYLTGVGPEVEDSNGGGAGGIGLQSAVQRPGGKARFMGGYISFTPDFIDYMARTGLAGGGAGGHIVEVAYRCFGGGAVRIAAPEIIISSTGIIDASGANSLGSSNSKFSGAGGGGTICIACKWIDNNGQLNVAGGNRYSSQSATTIASEGKPGWSKVYELGGS